MEKTSNIPRRAAAIGKRAAAALMANGTPPVIAETIIQTMLEELFPLKEVATRPRATGANEIVKHYCWCYVNMFNENPPVKHSDYGVVSNLLRQFSSAVVIDHLNSFAELFQSNTWYPGRGAGFSLQSFSSQWQAITAYRDADRKRLQSPLPRDCHHEPLCQNATEHTQKMLADLRGSFNPTKSSRHTVLKPSAAS